jgi:AcrR family transcriptional regulator
MPKIIENVKELLLIEARRTLLEQSYSELNIRDISKRCGIGIGTFYNYFSNKELLVSEIFRADWKLVSNIIMSAETETIEFKEKCRKIYNALDIFIQQYSDIFFEMSMSGSQKRPCQEINKYDLIYSQMRHLIVREIESNRIQTELTPDQLSRLLVSSFTFASKHQYIDFDTLYSSFNLS